MPFDLLEFLSEIILTSLTWTGKSFQGTITPPNESF